MAEVLWMVEEGNISRGGGLKALRCTGSSFSRQSGLIGLIRPPNHPYRPNLA
jgi:hypothetical protein